MADVPGKFYRATKVRTGVSPSSPGTIEGEVLPPVNPPGSSLADYVPYVGATENVDLGEYGVDAGFVTLDTTPTNTPTDQGTIYWDDSRSTAALIMNGTLQHIGQDTFYYVKNATGGTIAKGTCVGFFGTDGASGHILVFPFLANGVSPSSYFMGVAAEDISAGSFGQVMHFGELTGVNTSGFTAGALLYASTTVAGGFQTTPPVAPNNIILVAAAVNSKNNGAIVVRPQIGSNINTDEGVRITTPTTGDLLQLQVGGLWENKTVAQVIGSAYVPSSRTITINGTTQDLSANRTFNVGTVTSVTATSPLFSSGGATPNITIQQAGASASGFLSATDWNTFNNKQNALTNPVTGTGTTNYLPKFTGSTTIGNSQIFDDGTNVGIGTATPAAKLDISGGDLYVRTGGTIYANTLAPYSGNMTISLGGSGNNLIVSGGNVGIGTSTPNGLLHVKSSGAYGSLLVDNTGTTGGGYFASLQNGSTKGIVAVTGAIEGNTTSDFGMFAETGGALRFYVNGSATRVMSLTSGGNLLVGTVSDNGERLQVSGNGFFSGSSGFNRVRSTSTATTGFSGAAFEMYAYNGSSVTYGGGMFQTSSTFAYQQISANQTNIYGFQSGGMRLATGTAPIIFATGNADLDFSTARMTITSGGSVGIGTPSPAAKLEVKQTGSEVPFIIDSSAAANAAYTLYQVNNSGGWEVGMAGVNDGYKYLFSYGEFSAANSKVAITNTGNFLIGTTTDFGVRLAVSGNAHITNSDARLRGGDVSGRFVIGNSDTTSYLITNGSSNGNSINVVTNSFISFNSGASYAEAMRITPGGSVGIGTSSPSARLNIAGNLGAVVGAGNSAIRMTNTDSGNYASIGAGIVGVDNPGMQFSVDGTSRMVITGGGNVLIGTTTSTGAKLEVNGDIRTGALDGGYVSGFWKLGRALVGSQPSETHQIIVEINGALFTIGAAAL